MKAINWCKNNATSIMVGAGAAFSVAATIFSADGAIKAKELMDEKDMSKKEKLVTTVKAERKAILFEALSLGLIFGAHIKDKKTQASATLAYISLFKAFQRYKDKCAEFETDDGQSLDEYIEKDIVKDIIPEGAYSSDEVRLYYDIVTNTFYESTPFKQKEAEILLNKELNNTWGMFTVTLNQYCDILGLPDQGPAGDKIIWHADGMLTDYETNVFELMTIDEPVEKEGRLCYISGCPIPPTEDWYAEYFGD